MTREQTVQIVKQVIADYLKVNKNELLEQDELFEKLGIDSSGIVSLLLDIEVKCMVEFDMEDLQPEHLSTIDSLVKYIQQLK
ncbi:acyl carrier protein [Longirhabdus pacifica]|uniref:acyl carrier protein n=1 Tax=Longirhabdus pacifica TaxID=2305227 RepID=UPI001008DBF0|nr:acyl carrier protein [Longirhabdus pacifica]